MGVVGLLAIGIGGRSAMTEQRPSWISERTIPLGRERQWGLAMAMLGFGVSALGAFWVSDLFGGLGILGILLDFVGVGSKFNSTVSFHLRVCRSRGNDRE